MSKLPRAELGVDGNCGFALLGDDLQSGEAEFDEIQMPLEASKDPHKYHHADWCSEAKRSATRAYRKLKDRLSPREISYFLGSSYPD